MTDKEKQIDSLANALYNKQDEFDMSNPFEVAEMLYNEGYRKIPEGSVVLKGTETEERAEDLLTEFDEMSFTPLTTVPNPDEYAREYKKRLIYVIGQLRKEIAAEIYHKIKIKVLTEDMTDDRPKTLYRFTSFDIMKMARGIVEEFGVIFKNGHASAMQFGVEMEE